MAEIKKGMEVTLDEKTYEGWLEQMHSKGRSGLFFKTQLGRALDGFDPVAEEFLRRAAKEQPDFIKRSSFREHANRLKRHDMLSGRET